MRTRLMTLYLTPVVYTYMAAVLQKWRHFRKPSPVLEPAMQSGD